MILRKAYGAAIAAAAAGLLFAGGTTATYAADPMNSAMNADAGIKCSGVNACKGKTACKSATNECKGKNSCKAKGWINTATKEECTTKGGKVVEG